MKLYKSDHDIELVSDFDVVKKYPCVTVEKWNKWYSLYLVTEDGKVFNIEHEVYKEPTEPGIFTSAFKNTWYRCCEMHDHCWSPVHVISILAYFGIYMGEEAYKALVMMWCEQHCEEPGWEHAWLPTKELYDHVIVPDNGDITMCNSFSEEERKQFQFYREGEIYSLKNDFMFNDTCRKKIDKKVYTSAEFVNKSPEIEIKTGEPPIKKGVTIVGRYGGKSVLSQILGKEIPPETVQPFLSMKWYHSPLGKSERVDLEAFIKDLKELSEKYNIPIETAAQNPSDEDDYKAIDRARRLVINSFYGSSGGKAAPCIEPLHTMEVLKDRRKKCKQELTQHDTAKGRDEESPEADTPASCAPVANKALLEDALARLGAINKNDLNIAHQDADQILCDLLDKLGYEEVTQKWDKIPKWYS